MKKTPLHGYRKDSNILDTINSDGDVMKKYILTKNVVKDIPNIFIEFKSVPLRVWHKQRGVPIKIKSEKYKTYIRNNYGEKISIVRNAIWAKMETTKSYEGRKRHKSSNRWCKGSGPSSRRSFEYKFEDGFVWVKIISKWSSINVNKRKAVFDGKYLRLELKSNEIGIWYISEEGQIRCLILPKKIALEKELFELVGILDGEVCKKPNRKGRGGTSLKVSNAESTIIKHIIDSFKKYFNISKNDWSASLTINAKNFNPSKLYDKKLKQFWSREAEILLEKITKTTVTKKYISKFSPEGIIQIRYSSTLFWLIAMKFLKYMHPIVLSNKNYVVAYLRGLVAAEGGIGVHKNKTLRVIGIGGTKSEDKKFYMKCLKKINIDSFSEYKFRVEIYTSRNFLKLYKMNIFGLHPKRKKKFIASLRKIKKLSSPLNTNIRLD